MVSIPRGGRYKPNRGTYRQVLKSQEIADECAARGEPYGGGEFRHVDTQDRHRVKHRVYANNPNHLGGVRTVRRGRK